MAKRKGKDIEVPTQQRFENGAGFMTNAKPLSNQNVGLSRHLDMNCINKQFCDGDDKIFEGRKGKKR